LHIYWTQIQHRREPVSRNILSIFFLPIGPVIWR